MQSSAVATPDTVMLFADAGVEAGLGHLSRSSALAVALRCRGIRIRCHAFGADQPFDHDGVRWSPVAEGQLPDVRQAVLVVDSYRLSRDELERTAASNLLVLMHDYDPVPRGTTLVVSPTARNAQDDVTLLSGLEHAALRPRFWGLPRRQLDDHVEHVLVTIGGGKHHRLGEDIACDLADAIPSAHVTLVRGPHADTHVVLSEVDVLDAPDDLFEALLSVDVAVTGGGQTMLEAAAMGTPCIALPIADNQRRQVAQLAALHAVLAVDPPEASRVAAAARELARDAARRLSLGRRSQQAVDGYGALRVAFHVERLLSR